VRETGSTGAYTGRSSRTRSLSTLSDRSQPIRSAITVAGMSGKPDNSDRISASTASTIEPRPARTYFGGCSDRPALRTVLRDSPSFPAMALIGIPSARCRWRISAQSPTLITLHVLPHRHQEGVSFHPGRRHGVIFTRRRHVLDLF